MYGHASHVGNSNGTSSASNGLRSASPFGAVIGAATVSPFSFGSNANAASCASCGCTSGSRFFASQSSGPFGTAVGATNPSPFGQSSPRFAGFGGPSSAAAHGPRVSNPFSVSSRSPFQMTDPSTSLGSDKNRTTPVQTSPVVQTSVAQTNPAVTTSHVSPSAVGDLGSAPPPTPTDTAPFGSSTSALFDFFTPVIKDPSLIPKGLEMIVEHLGFNPWEGKNNLKDSQATTGDIINAFDDPDILSLAEFAVEQHNAMHQDGKVELLEVTAACLEAVDGGSRYHIILQAEPPASFIVHPSCFYAAVFRKNTDRRTPLIVLERWLYSRWSFRSSSSLSRSFK